MALLFLCNFNLGSSNDWASKGGSEEVDVLVDGVALNGREAQLVDEFVIQLFNIAFLRADFQSLLFGRLEILLLANVCHEADHIVTFFNEPCHCRYVSLFA